MEKKIKTGKLPPPSPSIYNLEYKYVTALCTSINCKILNTLPNEYRKQYEPTLLISGNGKTNNSGVFVIKLTEGVGGNPLNDNFHPLFLESGDDTKSWSGTAVINRFIYPNDHGSGQSERIEKKPTVTASLNVDQSTWRDTWSGKVIIDEKDVNDQRIYYEETNFKATVESKHPWTGETVIIGKGINFVATALSVNPVVLTYHVGPIKTIEYSNLRDLITSERIKNSNHYYEIPITIHSWKLDSTPAPDILFSWVCIAPGAGYQYPPQ